MTAQVAINSLRGFNRDLHEQFLGVVKRTGLTDARIAALIGIEPGVVFRYRHGADLEDLEVIEREVKYFITSFEERDLPSAPRKVCATSQHRAQMEFLRFCHIERKMGFSSGPSGDGKTVASLEYAKQYIETILIPIHVMRRSPSALLRGLSDAIDLSFQGSNDLVFDRVVERCKKGERFLIFDDCHFLGWECAELIRALHDQAGIGIALVGQPFFFDSVRRGARRGLLFDQILSRLAIRRESFPVKRSDVKLIVDSVIPGLDRDAMDFLFKRASGPGRFRTLTNLVDLAVKIGRLNKKKINVDILKQSERFLLVE